MKQFQWKERRNYYKITAKKLNEPYRGKTKSGTGIKKLPTAKTKWKNSKHSEEGGLHEEPSRNAVCSYLAIKRRTVSAHTICKDIMEENVPEIPYECRFNRIIKCYQTL